MAIRIRKIDGHVVALCAAKTSPELEDIYLDDNVHHALNTKFADDYEHEGLLLDPPMDNILISIMNELYNESDI